MWIVNLNSNTNGSHNHRSANHITSVPDGWAMIPDDFAVPDTFPFVAIEAEELTCTRPVEVIGEDGGPATEMREVTMLTVTAMTEGTLPEPVEAQPSQLDKIEAQVTYTAMMTDTLLEV